MGRVVHMAGVVAVILEESEVAPVVPKVGVLEVQVAARLAVEKLVVVAAGVDSMVVNLEA